MNLLEESFFTVKELAKKLKVSSDTIRRTFKDEPGTIDLSTTETKRGKRPFTKLAIPQSVAERVLRRRMK
jgi:methylphosphotriester-DNA--protein-cysteine methyltransferase